MHALKPRRARACLCAFAALAALLAGASSASASRGHVFEKTFAGPCTVEPCEGGVLKDPAGVAVNESSGDIYVVDREAGGLGRVVRFGKEGEFISEFNGSGELPGEGEAAGETGRFLEPEGIAVDNSTDEADPSKGDVYVVDNGSGHRVIDKYSAEGKFIAQITEAEGVSFKDEPLNDVAVDSGGKVWVYRGDVALSVARFSNATSNAFEPPPTPIGALEGFGAPGFAIDTKGDLYVRQSLGGGRIAKANASGAIITEEVDSEASSAVAVDPSTGNAFIDNLTTIAVFDAEGTEQERLGQEKGEKYLTSGTGIAVNAGAGSLYVADAATGEVVVFGPTEPSVPTIESESVSNISSDRADLGAEVNPRSEAGEAVTEYHFQYGACSSPSTCASSPYEASVPIPGGELFADFEVHAVSAELLGLTPNTTYHFRTIAANSHGQGEAGEERVFTTQGPGGELVLPDNRGWELVSPPDKQGALIEPISEAGVIQAAAGGGAITYLANTPIEAQPQGSTSKQQALSSRGPSAWSSRDIAIAHSSATGSAHESPEYKFFNPELRLSAVQPFGEFIPELSEKASESTAYLHDLTGSCGSSCFRPLVTGKPGFANVAEGTVFGEEEQCEAKVGSPGSIIACGPEFVGASEDLAHVVLRARAALEPGAGGEQLYEWSGGALSQVSLLPGSPGEPAPEGLVNLGLGDQNTRGAISAEGSRIVWEAKPNLYLRDMSRGETVQLDQAEAGCGECEGGAGRFQFASADGSRVLFSDIHRLTKDAGQAGSADLYECRIAIEEGGKLACALTDLTPKQGEESASVQGGLLGASEDGSYLYFVANGVLTSAPNARGERAEAGNCEGFAPLQSAGCNLYVRHNATTSFIARLAGGDVHDWSEVLSFQPTRVSPSGRFLELMSEARLSGYDNRDVATGKRTAEVFIYDAGSGQLRCASCDPTGARPVGIEYHKLEPGSGGLVGGPRGIWPSSALVAANVPGWTATQAAGGQQRHQPRYLANSGRLFFNTADALVPQDSNGTEDVYEYEPPGVGDCTGAGPNFSDSSGGCVSLVSSGGSAQESAFMDASESGDDVFFLTAAKLSPLDVDAALDIYDAHLCTSSAPCITASEVQSPPCTTEASCKASPTPQPSIFGAPASATFSGAGNPPPPPPPPKIETKAQKLAKALKACRAKKNKHKRQGCERAARKKYGAKAAGKPGHKHRAKSKSRRPK